MCGIVGYVGPQDALTVILQGLEKLEYRGYDSAGVAVFEGGGIQVRRAVGKLAELKKILVDRAPEKRALLGIGHTRWATHGRPSETNAHPHSAGRVSLIHNGIIENYVELKDELQKSGRKFQSETDTEVAAQLFDAELGKHKDPRTAFRAMCARIRGSFSFLAIDSQHPDRIFFARQSVPLIIGMGKGETFLASDIPAVLNATRDVIVLEDGDSGEIRAGSFEIEHNGKPVTRAPLYVTWDPVTAQKGGFKHFMLKEIYDQAEVLGEAIRGRVDLDRGKVVLQEFGLSAQDAKKISRIVFVGCGTAWHACLMAKSYCEAFTAIPCEVDYASEFRYRKVRLDATTLVVAISQSGETADTLAAIEKAQKTSPTMALCNVVGSSLARKVPHTLFTQAGPEISVASTKAFSTQLVVGQLFALYLGQLLGSVSEEAGRGAITGLIKLSAAVRETFKSVEHVKEVAQEFQHAQDFIFLGRGNCYPIALEGALKLKEISYIHAEGYPAGEMKHGPIALIDEKVPVVVVLQRSQILFDKTLSNLREVEARNGKIIAVTDAERNPELERISKHVIYAPYLSDQLSPLLLNIPLQLLAYYIAVLNGTDVDLPRNLAKSVTVE